MFHAVGLCLLCGVFGDISHKTIHHHKSVKSIFQFPQFIDYLEPIPDALKVNFAHYKKKTINHMINRFIQQVYRNDYGAY